MPLVITTVMTKGILTCILQIGTNQILVAKRRQCEEAEELTKLKTQAPSSSSVNEEVWHFSGC